MTLNGMNPRKWGSLAATLGTAFQNAPKAKKQKTERKKKEKKQTKIKACIRMFIVALYVIGPNWKTTQISIGGWINKLRSIYTVAYYSEIEETNV